MAALHKMGVIHRDLKSMNVLLDEKYYPKICDFASAESQLMTQQIGTPHWMAPEKFLINRYTSKVDVYAVFPRGAAGRNGARHQAGTLVLIAERRDPPNVY